MPRTIEIKAASDLSTDPVERALVAVQVDQDKPVAGDTFVLGDDMRWRRVDVLGLEPAKDDGGYGNNYLRPTSLSQDGTKLALPQPQAIVVVDLTTGGSERYDVPGLNQSAIWSADGRQILTATEERRRGRLLHLGDGSLEPTQSRGMSFDATFAPDGSLVELHEVADKGYHYEIRTGDSDDVPPVPLTVDASNGLHTQMVAANDNAVAFMRAVLGWSGPRDRAEHSGVLVVDRFTGSPLAQLPLVSYGLLYSSSPVGWLDDNTLLLQLGSDVVSWHYPSGELRRIMTTENQPVGTAFSPEAIAEVLD